MNTQNLYLDEGHPYFIELKKFYDYRLKFFKRNSRLEFELKLTNLISEHIAEMKKISATQPNSFKKVYEKNLILLDRKIDHFEKIESEKEVPIIGFVKIFTFKGIILNYLQSCRSRITNELLYDIFLVYDGSNSHTNKGLTDSQLNDLGILSVTDKLIIFHKTFLNRENESQEIKDFMKTKSNEAKVFELLFGGKSKNIQPYMSKMSGGKGNEKLSATAKFQLKNIQLNLD